MRLVLLNLLISKKYFLRDRTLFGYLFFVLLFNISKDVSDVEFVIVIDAEDD